MHNIVILGVNQLEIDIATDRFFQQGHLRPTSREVQSLVAHVVLSRAQIKAKHLREAMGEEGETVGIDGELADRGNALSQHPLDCGPSLTLPLLQRQASALTLLRSGDSHQDRDRWSYVLLAEELRRVSAQPKLDAAELFRRMTFNALISNTDDHPPNHAMIAPGNDFQLSPAYDLIPFPHVSLERLGDYGRYANATNLLSQAPRFLLTREAANRIVDEMESCVRARWYAVARREGVSELDCQRISRAFAYEGFRYKPVAQN